VKDNDFLNFTAPTAQGWGYAVFGKVVEGQDTVDKIAKVPTGNRGMYQNVPATPVVIEKAECV
jgi:peptidyl-prolyl cis-trans isomerase B (cyclophilin B)